VQLGGGGAKVLFQPAQLCGPRGGRCPWPLGQEPGQHELGGCDALPLTFPTEQVDAGLVSPAGLDRKVGQGGGVVGAVEGGALVDGAGEEAAAQGAVRHEPDPQLLTDRQHPLPIGFGAGAIRRVRPLSH
jgi:hypothetical protein